MLIVWCVFPSLFNEPVLHHQFNTYLPLTTRKSYTYLHVIYFREAHVVYTKCTRVTIPSFPCCWCQTVDKWIKQMSTQPLYFTSNDTCHFRRGHLFPSTMRRGRQLMRMSHSQQYSEPPSDQTLSALFMLKWRKTAVSHMLSVKKLVR